MFNLKDINAVVDILKGGGVIAHATETCYGFACSAFNEGALRKLYRLKQMDFDKPVSLLVANLKEAKKLGFFSRRAEELAKKYWPGPLTIVVKRKKNLPKFLNPKAKTVGIRVPDHKLSLELAKKFGSPLTTTSANISGQPSPYSVSAIKKQFKGQKLTPDLILNSGRIPTNPPSTIVDCSGKGLRVLRRGTIEI